MSNSSPKSQGPAPVPRPEEVVANYYDQLRAWALGLTRGDADAALDIVHDFYLYIRLAKPDFSRVENLDGYLYKCLRHIHLARLSESSRNAWQQISPVEMDSLEFASWANSESFVLERQNELRRICHYAVFRKDHTKSASFFILRFFHDYLPGAISEIANVALSVVQPSLSKARSELHGYLDKSADPQLANDTKAAHIEKSEMQWAPISSPEFHRELRETIMRARSGDCLKEEELLGHYVSPVPRAISCSLLSHIVSCERCLSIIDSYFQDRYLQDRHIRDRDFNLPKFGNRGPFDELACKGRTHRRIAGRSLHSMTYKDLNQIVSRHYEDVLQHRPRVLSIAVDGKTVASQHVEARRSVQSVRIDKPEQVSGIEVFSEQDVRLMLVLFEDLPPQGPSVRTEHIELSDGRWIELRLMFDSLGVNSEVTYFDPLLQIDTSSTELEDEGITVPASLRIVPAPMIEARGAENNPALLGHNSKKESASESGPRSKWRPLRRPTAWWSRLCSKAKQMLIPDMTPLLATALVLAVASLACFFVWMCKQPSMAAATLLEHAAKWEAVVPGGTQPGIIYQKVRITTQKRTLERAIYRDAQRRRRPKQRLLSPEDARVRTTLEAAGIDWDEPLSAADYRGWHDRQPIQRDQVTRTGKNLLTLTTITAAADSVVAQETLTVRENDFHPVERTVKLRDAETVEIAELNYDVIPWNMANPDWFEPSAVSDEMRSPRALRPSTFHVPLQLTDAQLDEAELEARLALNRLHVDSGRHIELTRGVDGIHIFGVVADAEQKRQIQSQLLMVPHVIPAISTIQELDNNRAANEINSVQAKSEVATEPSSVERFIAEEGMDRSIALPLTQRIVDNSFAVTHESKAIGDLLRQFSENQTLTPGARMALSELVTQHKATLLATLQEEQQRLTDLKLIAGVPDLSRSVQDGSDELETAAQRNSALCVELTSPAAVQPRRAQQIAPQLAESISWLRAIALRISASSLMPSPASSKATADNDRN